jgi:hypothetical protein
MVTDASLGPGQLPIANDIGAYPAFARRIRWLSVVRMTVSAHSSK